MSLPKEYKYYAFISYSRKNSPAAAFLQKGLEKFKVPVRKVAATYLPADKKYMKPIFRDKRDLEVSEKKFTDEILHVIGESRYLLVLCSPESAASKWVNLEIENFLLTHNNDFSLIVPVILKGAPSSNDETECLPPALRREEITCRNLPRMIADDGETEKDGWENGLVQAISYMLRVKRESIKAAIDTERVHFYQRCAAVSIMVVLIFAALTLWAIRAETKAKNNEQRAIAGEKKALVNEQRAIAGEKKALINEQRAIAGEKKALINEKRAKEQANIAQESLDFLGDVFRSSDSTISGNKDMKVLDAIYAKIPEISKIKEWQLQVSVAMTLSGILHNLGDTNSAYTLLTTARVLLEKHASDTLELAECYNRIARVCSSLGKQSEALAFFNKELKIKKKILPANHPDLIASRNKTRTAHSSVENRRNSMRHYRKPPPHKRHASPAKHSQDSGKYSYVEAEFKSKDELRLVFEHLESAVLITKNTFPANHPADVSGYYSQGFKSISLKNYKEALAHFEKALTILKQRFPEKHPFVAYAYNNIGIVYYSQEKKKEAMESFKKSLEIFKQTLLPNHTDFAICYNNIGLVYSSNGDFRNAEQNFYKAAQIFRSVSPYSRDITVCWNNLGLVAVAQKRFDRALKSFDRGFMVRYAILPINHPDLAKSFINTGFMRAVTGQHDKALKNYETALQINRASFTENHPAVGKCYGMIGEVYFSRKEYRKAKEYYEKAYEIMKKNSGANHPGTKLYFNRLKESESKIR